MLVPPANIFGATIYFIQDNIKTLVSIYYNAGHILNAGTVCPDIHSSGYTVAVKPKWPTKGHKQKIYSQVLCHWIRRQTP